MSSLRSANSMHEKGGAIVPGEFLLTQRDFCEIAAMIHADAGIALPELESGASLFPSCQAPAGAGTCKLSRLLPAGRHE